MLKRVMVTLVCSEACYLFDVEEKEQSDEAALGHIHAQQAGCRTVCIGHREAVGHPYHYHGTQNLVHEKTAHQKRRKHGDEAPCAGYFEAGDACNVSRAKK